MGAADQSRVPMYAWQALYLMASKSAIREAEAVFCLMLVCFEYLWL